MELSNKSTLSSLTKREPHGKVLVIDDEPDIIDIITDILKSAGFGVVGKTNSEEAVQEFKSINPDVVLTDFSMPKLDGLRVLKEIRKQDPDIPVIYISGYVTKEVLIESMEHGIYGAIEKPFNEKSIIQISINALQKHRLNRLLNHSFDFILQQGKELDECLKKQGNEELRRSLNQKLQLLLDEKKQLMELTINNKQTG